MTALLLLFASLPAFLSDSVGDNFRHFLHRSPAILITATLPDRRAKAEE